MHVSPQLWMYLTVIIRRRTSSAKSTLGQVQVVVGLSRSACEFPFPADALFFLPFEYTEIRL